MLGRRPLSSFPHLVVTMYVIVVYDTLAKRNPGVLRTCRLYLHHIQRSVFEGPLSHAQLRRFRKEIEGRIDPSYDRILVYTFPPGSQPVRQSWGASDLMPEDIL